MSWDQAAELTPSRARVLLAACERRDASDALMRMRCALAATGAVMGGKGGHKGYRNLEKKLAELAETGGEKPPARKQVKGLAFLARAAGAQVNPGRN